MNQDRYERGIEYSGSVFTDVAILFVRESRLREVRVLFVGKLLIIILFFATLHQIFHNK